jgi:iron complex transport system substrate-binding protein
LPWSRIVPTFASPAPRPARLAYLLFVALVAVACSSGGSSSPVAGPASPSIAAPSVVPSLAASPPAASPAAVTFPLTLTDDEGTSVTLPAEPQRIVSLTPAETEILFALGAGNRVVGKVEDVANFPPEAADVPVMGRFDGVDVEQIVDAGADLVVAGGSGGTPPDAIGQLRALGVPVLVVYAQDVDGALADIDLTAAAVGRSAEGAALVADMRQSFEKVAAATAGVERPRVFIETGNQPAVYGIADESVYAEMIQLAGGEAVTTGSATNWEMPVERLVAEDPEIILLADAAYGATAEEVRGRPGWGVISAVRDGAIHPIDDIVLTRPGPRLVEGLQALLAALHPEVDLELGAPSASPSGG